MQVQAYFSLLSTVPSASYSNTPVKVEFALRVQAQMVCNMQILKGIQGPQVRYWGTTMSYST